MDGRSEPAGWARPPACGCRLSLAPGGVEDVRLAATRTESDSMGEMEVPAEAYYGAQTQRAARNFQISKLRFPREFIRAMGLIKKAAARVNMDLGLLDPELGAPIIRAAQAVAEGKHDDQFVLDVFQTGSGTSTNMNANEVIAGIANERFAGARGGERRSTPTTR